MGAERAKRTRARGGVTLVEVLVAIAAALILFGIAMGVLVATNRTADNVIARDSLLQHAQLNMKQIRAVLEGVVWPEDLGTTPPPDVKVGFARDALSVVSSHQPTTTGQFCLYSLGYRIEVGGNRSEAPGFVQIVPGEEEPRRFGDLAGPYRTTIEFRYATDIGKDLKPVWKESLGTGERPRLIWVQMVVSHPTRLDRQGRPEQVRLQTAVAL